MKVIYMQRTFNLLEEEKWNEIKTLRYKEFKGEQYVVIPDETINQEEKNEEPTL